MSQPIDMSAFEEQFIEEGRLSRLMSNDDFDRLAFLNVRIDDIEGVVELREDENSRLEISQSELNKKLAELRKTMDMLLQMRTPIDDKINRNKQQNREDKTKRASYERERARLLQELLAVRNFLSQRDTLLEKTKEYPWAVGVDGKKALPHQIEGAHRLVASRRALLGDKPGLGKTLQAIMTIDLLRADNRGKKVLIFTPKPVLDDFERSFKRWTNPTFVHVLNQTLKGIKTELLEAIRHLPEAIVITNYEVWRKDISIHAKLIECGFDTVICDEAHVLKGEKTITTKRIRELVFAENLCPKCGAQNIGQRGMMSVCLSCEYAQLEFGEFCSVKEFFPLTGTPILNAPEDLFPLLNMMDRESFPTRKTFLDDYCVKTYDYGRGAWVYTFGTGGSERLLKKLGMRFTARDRDSAGVVMPPQEIKHHWLELDPEEYPRQHKFVTDLRERARLAFSETEQMTTQATLAWYTRMRQAASWPDGIKIKGCAHTPECLDEFGLPGGCYNPTIIFPPPGTPPIGESVMMDESERIIFEAVEDGDRIVVFTFYRAVIDELERRCNLKGLRVAKINGDVPDKLRKEYIDDFNETYTKFGEHKYDVLLTQSGTSSVGINLNGAQQSLIIEREWNPGKEQQMIDRVRRLDSKFETIVHILHCAGTATELIDAIQEQKKAMLDGFEADVNLQEAMRKFLEG